MKKCVRLVRGKENAILAYGYTPSGKKAFVAWMRADGSNKKMGKTEYRYGTTGLLAEIAADGKVVAKYSYTDNGLPAKKVLADGTKISYRHDLLGRIAEMKVISAKGKTLMGVRYSWDAVGQLASRTWDGVEQKYSYDPAGQLVAVTSSDPQKLPSERYVFDLVGNMTEKTVGGIRTRMSYDTANRLLASATEKQAGAIEQSGFKYDNAGRLIAQTIGKETTRYQYGLFEKTSGVIKPDGKRVGFDYWPDGQISAKGTLPPMLAEKENTEAGEDGEPTVASFLNGIRESKSEIASDQFKETESLLWDGLALIQRGDDVFSVEPHISGGIPVATGNRIVISDFLGTTLGTVQGETFTTAPTTSFGEALAANDGSLPQFYTGKPWDSDLQAYNFLFRNYQPQMARWTATDPSGFPDGLNVFAYCLNSPMNIVDSLGLSSNGAFIAIYDGGDADGARMRSECTNPDSPFDYAINLRDSNWLQQLTDLRSQLGGIDSIGIDDHSFNGYPQFGDSAITDAILSSILSTIDDGGSLVFYGCSVSAGTSGADFLRHVSQLRQNVSAVGFTEDTLSVLGANGYWQLVPQGRMVEYVNGMPE